MNEYDCEKCCCTHASLRHGVLDTETLGKQLEAKKSKTLWQVRLELLLCLHLWSRSLEHITGDSPYASTDVLEDKFQCEAIVHFNPETWQSSLIHQPFHGYYTS